MRRPTRSRSWLVGVLAAGVLAVAGLAAAGCGGSSGGGAAPSSTSAVPELLPGTADRFLVRRAFTPTEPLADYGLDPPRADVPVPVAGQPDVVLHIGDQVFDGSAYYVQRDGDPRVWLVLTESIAPLLGP